MIKIRDLRQADYEFLDQRDPLLQLSLQYNRDYERRNAIVTEEDGAIVGIAVARKHFTWDSPGAKVNKMVAELCTDRDDVRLILINGLKDKIDEIQKCFPEKNVALTAIFDTTEIKDTQLYLNQGFYYDELIPVLGYNLENAVKHFQIPEGIRIVACPKDKVSVEQYIQATGEANEGIYDSMNDYLFQQNDPSFESFMAVTHTGKVVGGISSWKIDQERAATENIFVVPEYRRNNIARELIATVLERLKRNGMKLATLSMYGDNMRAMRLYQGIGYELSYYLVELIYQPVIL